MISLVVAMDRNRLIGRDGDLPWRLPNDLKHFKRLTVGKTVLMGRKTWISLGRPLPDRDNWVLTRDPSFAAEGCRVFHSLEEALAAHTQRHSPRVLTPPLAPRAVPPSPATQKRDSGLPAADPAAEELMVIGGAELYRQTLPLAQRLYITEVDAQLEGDTHFPVLEPTQWRQVSADSHPADDRHAYAYTFKLLERRA